MNDYDEIVEDEVLEDADSLEDNPLYDALTEEPDSGKDDDNDEDNLDEFDPEDGDSEEVLRTKLTAKNRILRQRAKTTTRLKTELEELRAQVNAGNGGLSKEDIADVIAAAKGGGDDNGETEQERIQALKDRLDEEPTSIVDILSETNIGLENKLAKILQGRDAYWEEKIASITAQNQTEQLSPEVKRLVGMLKQKPEYKDIDEGTLVKFAKDLAPLGTRVTGKRPPATTSGTGKLPFNAKTEQVEKVFSSQLDAMGYGSDD